MSCDSVCERYDKYMWSEEVKCAGDKIQILINQVRPIIENIWGPFEKYLAVSYRDRKYENGQSFLYLVKVDTEKGHIHLKIGDEKTPCDPCRDVQLCAVRMGHTATSCLYDLKREIWGKN